MYTGPNIVNEGLVFGIDSGYGIANTGVPTRFFKGKPATNLASGLIKTFGSWSNLQGSTEYYTRGGSQGVHLIVTGSGGVQWHGSDQINSVSASTQYTISATIKWTGVTPHTNLFYIRQYNSSSSQVSESGQFSTSYMIDLGDGWYRAYRTFTTTSTTDYVRIQGYQYSANANIYYQDEQFELGSLTPYAGDGAARSNTDSLIDLKRKETLTVANISFDSTGQPDYDGTNDYLRQTLTGVNLNSGCAIEGVLRRNTTPSAWRTFFNIKPTGANAPFFEFRSGANNQQIYADYYNGSADYITPTASLTTGEFGHAVCCYDGSGNLKMYLNGSLIGTKTGVPTFALGTNPVISVGIAYSNDRYTDISAPVVKVYDKALSVDEVKQNYNAYRKRFNI